LLLRALLLAAHRQVVPRARRFHEHCGVRRAGFPYRRGVPQPAFEGVERTVYANPASVRDGRFGEARPWRARRYQDQSQRLEAEGRKKPGRPAAPPSTTPDPKAQKNFTDPESRIMKSKDGFVLAYNAQIAVDSAAQIIVAQDVTQSGVDSGQLVPMIDATKTN